MSNLLIEAAARFLSQTRNVYESEEKYPTHNHLHLDSHEGERRHIIKGISHSEKNGEHVKQKVFDRMHKAWGKNWKEIPQHKATDAALRDIPAHHDAAPDPENSHKMKPRVHDSVDSYVKHAALSDQRWGFKQALQGNL